MLCVGTKKDLAEVRTWTNSVENEARGLRLRLTEAERERDELKQSNTALLNGLRPIADDLSKLVEEELSFIGARLSWIHDKARALLAQYDTKDEGE